MGSARVDIGVRLQMIVADWVAGFSRQLLALSGLHGIGKSARHLGCAADPTPTIHQRLLDQQARRGGAQEVARVLRPGLKVLFITGYAESAIMGEGPLAPRHACLDQALCCGCACPPG